jgi:hypothetical protein
MFFLEQKMIGGDAERAKSRAAQHSLESEKRSKKGGDGNFSRDGEGGSAFPAWNMCVGEILETAGNGWEEGIGTKMYGGWRRQEAKKCATEIRAELQGKIRGARNHRGR